MSEFEGKGRSFDTGYASARRSEPAPRERTANQKAEDATAIARNLDGFEQRVHDGIAAMGAATQANDRAAWDVAKREADAGVRDLRAHVKPALEAATGATDAQVRERLATIEEVLKEAENATTTASAQPPTLRAPELSIADDLLAALPPDHQVSPAKSFYETAQRAVEWVFRERASTSDLAAFKEIVARHRDHEIARRFRRFGRDKQDALLALFEKNDVKLPARKREEQRRAAAATAQRAPIGEPSSDAVHHDGAGELVVETAALEPAPAAAVELEPAPAAVVEPEHPASEAASEQLASDDVALVQRKARGAETAEHASPGELAQPAVVAELAETVARDAVPIARGMGLTTFDPARQITINEDGAPAGRANARGAAHEDVIHLDSKHVGAADAREVIVHEVAHLAQAKLPASQDQGREAAEHEAAELAAEIAAGAAPRPPAAAISLTAAAADSDAPRAPRGDAVPGGLGPRWAAAAGARYLGEGRFVLDRSKRHVEVRRTERATRVEVRGEGYVIELPRRLVGVELEQSFVAECARLDAQAGAPNAQLDEEALARRKQLMSALALVTPRWQQLGGALFTAADAPVAPHPPEAFTAQAYGLLLEATTDVAPVELVLAGPGREPYARAFAEAAKLAERDRPRLSQIRTDIADLATGGELEFAATRLVSTHALLSALGKDALRSRGELAKDPIFAYAHADAVAHGVKIKCSRLVAEGVDFVSAAALAAHGGPERSRAVIALGNMLIAGAAAPTPAALPAPSADPAAVTVEAAALTKLVQDAIAQVSANHKLAPDVFQRLDTALGAASPRARELVWANHDVTAALARALDPSQSKALLGKLDPVEALYQTVKPSEWRTVITLKFAPPPPRLLADNPAYPALRAWLEAHPGEPNRALRARLLEHAPLKRDVIDRLPADQQPIIYRLITSGSAAPTAEDQVHEAAERGRGADVVRALRALASTAPARLAELERDAVFRRAIEGLRDVVDVDGVPLRPYDVCLTLWGRNPREAAERESGASREVNATDDERPLTADERLRLDSELFDPALADIHAQVANQVPRRPGLYRAWNAGLPLQRAQAILDRLRLFERQAAQPAYKDLLQRERLVAGAELGQRFGRRWNIDLRTWVYETGGPNIRSGVARILGTELGAAVGTFNGEQVGAGDALPEKMTLQQALRETTAGAEGWTISEWCSVESRALSRAIDDQDKAAALTSWERFAGAIGAAAPELARLTGRTLRPIDLLRNAMMEHGGHLETRIAERFTAAARDELSDRLGLTAAAREDAAHAPPPDVAQQADAAYGASATQLWSCLAALGPRSALSEYTALGRLLTLVRNLPRLDATPADPHAVEEQPPRSFAAYYRAQYGASIDGHAEAVLRAMPERARAVPLADACREFGLDPQRLGAVFQQPAAEALAIDAHNQHLVRAEFTVDNAKGRARQIWQVLHGSGRLETIHTQLYGDCNDEEQRLIRIAFRQLSGGFDLTFYVRQAIDAQQRQADEHADDSALAQAAAAVANQDQQLTIGATGSLAGAQVIAAGGGGGTIHVHGTETELARGLAVAKDGQIDLKTSLDAAARREDADQVFRALDEATPADKRAILADGPLVNRLRSLGQWQWERCFKVLSNQADLADRLYSRSHGDGGVWEGAFGGTHETGIKEDLKGNGRRLRLKYDAEVRAEIAGLREPPAPQAIDREIHRRVLDAAGFDAANPSVEAILQSELSGDELAEMQAMVRNAGTARDWAVACGGGAAAIRAEIRALSPAERAAKLRDPRYLQLLGERLTDPVEHRAALNALGATDDADIAHEGGALARLDAAVRAADARRTLRALSELTPDEHARVRSDAQLTSQIMAALSVREQQVARELLGFEVVAEAGASATTETSGAPATDASDPAVGAEASAAGAVRQRAALFVHQSAGRLRVACLGSWRDVLVQAAEIYKLDFALGFTQHGEGGHAQAAAAPRPALDTAALRAQIWTRANALVRAFAAEHQADPGKKTRDAVTAPQMIEIVQAAVLAQRDPSDALIAENIFTADEQRAAAPDPMVAAVFKAREFDASTDATGLAATLRAASDQHVIEHWTSIKRPPAGHDGDTLDNRYRELVTAEAAAADHRKTQQSAPQPATSARDVDPAAAPATAASAAPAAANATAPRVDAPLERAAVQAQRRFLEYQIKIAEALEEMLLPYMGDDRAATQARARGEQQIVGRDNKRYNDLAQIIYQRIPQLPAERVGQAIGVRPEHQWLLASEARRHAGEVYTRDQRHLRNHGEQTSAGSVAQDEKEIVQEEQTRLGRHHAQAIVDGEVTSAEGAEYDRRYAAVDRAQEAHQAAKEAAAAWASLIVGVVVTLAATVLTGGLATGPVAMMALAGATAALSATAKSLVMERVLEGEWDREDAARMISTEVITGIVTMGTTYYAQRLLAAAGVATSLAKQGAAVRQVLRRPPRLFQSIAHEAAEEVISEGMSGVVEAGLAATDPAHWMHGYEEGARSAQEAALARLAQVDNHALQGGVTAVLTSVGSRVLHRSRRGGGHIGAGPVRDRSLDVPAKQKKRVDVARNLKQTLGDPGEKFMEALIQWGMQQDGPINWGAAPSELLRGWIEEMGEGAVEVHTGTVHRAKRDAFTKAEIAKAKDRVPAHELADYQQMQDGALDTDVLVSIGEYQRIREYVILRGLSASEARGGFTLTPVQRRAFIEWVRVNTPRPDQLAITAATDPRTIPEVVNAASPAPEPRARPAAKAPGGGVDSPSMRPTEKMPAVDPETPSRPTVTAVDSNEPSQRPTVQMPAVDANEPSQRPTVQMPAVDANEPSQRPTVQMPAVGDSSRVVTGPRQVYADIPALESLSEAPSHAMFGAHQQSRVEPALQRLSDADYAAFRALIAAESHPVAQAFLFKALASNNTLDDIRWLAGEITGKDATWMADNLTLGDPREVGGGVKQQWSMSCNASTTITLRGNYDPIFALRLRHRNMDVGNVDDDDPNAMNMNQSDLEKSMLESGYRGAGLAPEGHQGRAMPRGAQHGVGRPADDLFNDQSAATGMRFTTTWMDAPADALPLLDDALSQGMQVPVVIGDARKPTAHYVLAMARRENVSGGFEYQFHDTWTGLTRWVTAQQIASGQMPLSWGAIAAIEAPSAISGPPPLTIAPPQDGAQHGSPAGPGSGKQYPQRPTLIADHTESVVEWAEESLPDVEVPALLNSLEPKTTLELCKNITAVTAQQLTVIYTPPLVNKVVPPWTGKELEIEVELVGAQTAVQIVGSNAGKPDKTLPHAKGLESHRAGEIDKASALERGSLMVDANFIISVHKLMSGVPWYNKDRSKPQLQEGQRAMVNHLRDMAGLPSFPTDAEVVIKADTKWLIGDLDLRAANVVIGESAPRPAELMNGAAKPGELKTGLVVGDRESPEYNAVLAQLKALDVGGADGAKDQAMVADALFARRADPSHEAVLSTFDAGVYLPLGKAFATYTPQVRHGTKGAYENHAEAIARTFHGTGFLIKIDDGLGNSYELRIFPVSAKYKTPNSPLPK